MIAMKYFCVIILSCFAFTRAMYDMDSPVVQLDKTSISQVHDSEHLWIVEFYAPWCGHCKQLKPEFESAAADLQKYSVKLAAVDCDANPEMAQAFGIQGFPTIKVFSGPPSRNPYTKQAHRMPTDYTGSRTAAGLKKYGVNKMPSFVVVHSTDQATEYDNWKTTSLETSPKIALVLSTKDKPSSTLKALSMDLRGRLPVGMAAVGEQQGGAAALLEEQGLTVEDLPTLVVLDKDGGAWRYEGDLRSKADMLSFLEQHAAPLDARPKGGDEDSKVEEDVLGGAEPLTAARFHNEVLGDTSAWVVAYVASTAHGDALPAGWSRLVSDTTNMGLVRVGVVDCAKEKLLCSEDYLAGSPLPAVHVYPYGVEAKAGKEEDGAGEVAGAVGGGGAVPARFSLEESTLARCKRKASESLPNYVTSLPAEALDQWMLQVQEQGRMALLLLSNKDTPPAVLKAMPLAFGGSVMAAMLSNPDEATMSRFQATALPHLAVFFSRGASQEDPNQIVFQMANYNKAVHGEYSFSNLAGFLHSTLQMAQPGAKLQGAAAGSAAGAGAGGGGAVDDSIVELTADNLEARCLSKGLCAIALLAPEGTGVDDDAQLSAQLDLMSAVQASERSGGAPSPFAFTWMDGSCHAQALAERFGVQEHMLPTLLVFSPSKMRFAQFVGSFSSRPDLSSFLRGVVSGRSPTQPLTSSDPLSLSVLRGGEECVAERAARVEAQQADLAAAAEADEDDDDDMAAMLAEIKAEEEQRKKELEEALVAEEVAKAAAAEAERKQKLKDLAAEQAAAKRKSSKKNKKKKKGKKNKE